MPSMPLLLVVEDEILLHHILEDELTTAGFALQLEPTGENAIRQLEERGESYSALVTDIRLGSGMTGWAVAHRARELFPALPVVYMSGDSAADWPANGVPNSIMLAKPFAMAQLVTAISQLMNAANSTPH